MLASILIPDMVAALTPLIMVISIILLIRGNKGGGPSAGDDDNDTSGDPIRLYSSDEALND